MDGTGTAPLTDRAPLTERSALTETSPLSSSYHALQGGPGSTLSVKQLVADMPDYDDEPGECYKLDNPVNKQCTTSCGPSRVTFINLTSIYSVNAIHMNV